MRTKVARMYVEGIVNVRGPYMQGIRICLPIDDGWIG